MRLSGWVILLATVAVSCSSVEPPPADAVDALRWLYRNYETADDESILQAFANFDAAWGVKVEDEADDRLEDTLVVEDIADTGLANDPTKTFGIIAATEIPCSLDSVVALHTALNQNEIHDNEYDSYVRTYNTDAPSEWPQSTAFIGWDTQYTLSVVGIEYTAKIRGGARAIEADPAKFPSGRVVLGRAWLKEPAVFDGGDSYFKQDYQLDLYYERGPNKVLHVFAAWREMQMGVFSPDTTADFMRGGTHDADDRVADRCKK